MARFYVFDSQAEAQACVDGIDARARQIYRMRGFTEDPATGGFLSKDAVGNDIPGAVTEAFDVPRQRVDGRWVVSHCEVAPYATVIVPLTPPQTVAGYVAQDIPAGTPIESEAPEWWPAPEGSV